MRRLDLLRKYDKPVPRYTSYPTAAAFHAGVGAAELAAQLAIPSEDPLSLYVHVPFCRHACLLKDLISFPSGSLQLLSNAPRNANKGLKLRQWPNIRDCAQKLSCAL